MSALDGASVILVASAGNERGGPLAANIPSQYPNHPFPAPHPAPTAGASQEEEEGLENGNAFLQGRLSVGQAETLLLHLKLL